MRKQANNGFPISTPAIAALVYTFPFLMKLNWWGVRDWDLFTTIAAVPTGTVLQYFQFPFWNPYIGGGNILFHHPEVLVLSPFFPLYLFFGALVGLKIQVLICYYLGFWGSEKFARTLGLSVPASIVVAFAYFGSVHFALHFAEGHMPFTHFCFLPWFLHFVLKATERRRNIVYAAITLALMILGNGAAIPFLYTMTFGGLFILLRALNERQFREIVWFALSTVGGVLLSAVKFIPMVIYLINNSWEGNPHESIPMSALDNIFFGFKHSLFISLFEGQQWSWHEYGAYISPVLVLLAVVALLFAFRRRWIWLALGLFFLFLGLGDHGPAWPWTILSGFPGFSSARCTGRSFQFVILSFAILGGFGIDDLRQRWSSFSSRNWRKLLLWAAGVIIIATNVVLALPIMNEAFRQPPVEVERSEQFVQVVDREAHVFRNYLQNRGSLVTPWLSAYHPSRGLVDQFNRARMDYVVYGNIEVIARDYTPNRITYEIDAQSKGQLAIGMGYDPGWSAWDGRQLREFNGVMMFDVQKGKETVVLTYRTPYFYPSLAVWLLAIGLATVVWRKT